MYTAHPTTPALPQTDHTAKENSSFDLNILFNFINRMETRTGKQYTTEGRYRKQNMYVNLHQAEDTIFELLLNIN